MKSFYKNFFLLMIPMALKELISALVNLVDTIMVGQLGEASIAAVGIGNQVYFLYTVFLFGLTCGAGVFSAQFWGLQDIKKMRKTLGLSLILAMGLAGIFVFAAWVFPTQIFQASEADAQTLKEGVTYLRIVSIGYLATAITTCFDSSVCASENAGLPFLVRAVGLGINIVFNQILIFGLGTIPAMGITGAAIATVIARGAELILMLGVVYGKKMIQAARIKELLTVPKDLWGRFFKTSSPVVFNEICWAVGIFLYSWAFARINTEAMVVITIVQNVERLMLVFFHGSGNAGGVFIGKAVGAGRYEDAYRYGKHLIGLCLGTAVVFSTAFILARPLVLRPYSISEAVYNQCMQLLVVTAIMMGVKAITFLLIVGVFRNGGDTVTGMRYDVGTVWFIGVPVVLLSVFVLKLPLLACYSLMCLEEVGKIILSLRYFFTKKWIKSVVT